MKQFFVSFYSCVLHFCVTFVYEFFMGRRNKSARSRYSDKSQAINRRRTFDWR